VAFAAHEQIEFPHKWIAPEHVAERKSSSSRATPMAGTAVRELLARNRLRATSRPVLHRAGHHRNKAGACELRRVKTIRLGNLDYVASWPTAPDDTTVREVSAIATKVTPRAA
jgi:hypothetical protein